MAKILIAEDERDIRELITFTLTFAGHEVIPTTNGAEAVEVAKRENPELILLDVRMPQMTGYEACKALKADAALEKIPVAFLSAKGQEGEIQEGLAAGAVAYILKPFAPDDLTQRVQEILTEHI
jgi:CheY-like chemotaxis protein